MKYRAQCAAILLSLASIAIGRAEPLEPRVVHVIDGDTIRVHGNAVRLVGFDAPETGERARCEAERTLGARALFRLRQIVASGGIDLRMISCSCRPRTEGTLRCNYGRSCGTLTAASKDVGKILISEGLAHEYVCGQTSCPPRRDGAISSSSRCGIS